MFENKTRAELVDEIKDLIKVNNKNFVEHQRIEREGIGQAKRQKEQISRLQDERTKLLEQVDDLELEVESDLKIMKKLKAENHKLNSEVKAFENKIEEKDNNIYKADSTVEESSIKFNFIKSKL